MHLYDFVPEALSVARAHQRWHVFVNKQINDKGKLGGGGGGGGGGGEVREYNTEQNKTTKTNFLILNSCQPYMLTSGQQTKENQNEKTHEITGRKKSKQ